MTNRIEGNITPTDVKIYMEDEAPYLDYIGTCYIDGCKCKIHFPKIGLNFSNITQEEESVDYIFLRGYKHSITTSFNVYATDNVCYKFEVIEREVSKKQLEKELGYKLNIKE